MSLWASLKSSGRNGFGYGSTAEDVTDDLELGGKTILVTGCNSGLGMESMRVLARRGAHVIGTARTLEKASAACAAVPGKTTPLSCELAEPASVRGCVQRLRDEGVQLDALIANAGIMALPELETVLGYEKQFFTNHIGHFALITGLLDSLNEQARIVILSSDAHRRAPPEGIQFDNLDGARGYIPWAAYGQSKLANLLFAKELARRLRNTQITVNACHPGVINTNLSRHMNPVLRFILGAIAGPLLLKSVAQGAATQCYLAVHPQVEGVTGTYFADCNETACRSDGTDM